MEILTSQTLENPICDVLKTAINCYGSLELNHLANALFSGLICSPVIFCLLEIPYKMTLLGWKDLVFSELTSLLNIISYIILNIISYRALMVNRV